VSAAYVVAGCPHTNCKVIMASPRRLIKGATFYTGEILSRALGRNINKGETSAWGRRHPHNGGEIIMPLFFRQGRILPGETYFSDTGSRKLRPLFALTLAFLSVQTADVA